jgi:hypothetical protein
MRALVHQWLTSHAALTALIPAERWIQQGALDNPPARPFAVVGFTDRPRSDVGSAQPRLAIWVHDDRGSYSRIDSVVELLEADLPNATPLEDSANRIVDIRWDGSSADLTDDGYSTNVRNVNFTLTGRK